jgi:flagellar biosynthesis GTPase FlhF
LHTHTHIHAQERLRSLGNEALQGAHAVLQDAAIIVAAQGTVVAESQHDVSAALFRALILAQRGKGALQLADHIDAALAARLGGGQETLPHVQPPQPPSTIDHAATRQAAQPLFAAAAGPSSSSGGSSKDSGAWVAQFFRSECGWEVAAEQQQQHKQATPQRRQKRRQKRQAPPVEQLEELEQQEEQQEQQEQEQQEQQEREQEMMMSLLMREHKLEEATQEVWEKQQQVLDAVLLLDEDGQQMRNRAAQLATAFEQLLQSS